MYSTRVCDVMDPRKLVTAAPATTVEEAARRMAEARAGAVLVLAGKQLAGIFTERDAVCRVIARGCDARSTPLADVMTPSPITLTPDKSYGYALLVMHGHDFRHLPVVDRGCVVGIVSARNALDPDLEEFVAESNRRAEILRAGS